MHADATTTAAGQAYEHGQQASHEFTLVFGEGSEVLTEAEKAIFEGCEHKKDGWNFYEQDGWQEGDVLGVETASPLLTALFFSMDGAKREAINEDGDERWKQGVPVRVGEEKE